MKKLLKTMTGFLAALSLIISTSTSAFAADVEVQGEGTESKSQTIQVSASIASVYAVTMPAVIELKYDTVTGTDDTVVNTGYFCDIRIGAAGKILSSQSLKMELGDSNNTMSGSETGNSIELKAVISSCDSTHGYLVPFSTYNSSYNTLTWTASTIGTADYDGINLSNCEYTYKTISIGFDESAVTDADIYSGTITINFGLK